MAKGVLKWYSQQKGFGFIIPDDGGKDIFLHSTDVRNSRINSNDLTEGCRISYSLKEHRGKTSAVDVVIE